MQELKKSTSDQKSQYCLFSKKLPSHTPPNTSASRMGLVVDSTASPQNEKIQSKNKLESAKNLLWHHGVLMEPHKPSSCWSEMTHEPRMTSVRLPNRAKNCAMWYPLAVEHHCDNQGDWHVTIVIGMWQSRTWVVHALTQPAHVLCWKGTCQQTNFNTARRVQKELLALSSSLARTPLLL